MSEIYNCNNCKYTDGNVTKCGVCTKDPNKPDSVPSRWEPADEELIDHPAHYQTKSGIESIDAIEAFTEDLIGYEAVDTGNVLKYMFRWKKKNGLQDLKKARWYLNRLIKNVEMNALKVGEIRADILYASKSLEEMEKENK